MKLVQTHPSIPTTRLVPICFDSSFLQQKSSIHGVRFYKISNSSCLGKHFIQESTQASSEFLTTTR